MVRHYAREGRGPFVSRQSLAILFVFLFWSAASLPASANVGYRDFSYGSANTPTADKPQNKLWWNDGFWWGGLYNTGSAAFMIYRLDMSSQTWINTGTKIDPRSDSHLDTLWDGQKLYIVAGSLSGNALLYRYSYGSGAAPYTLDSGFPVSVRPGDSESIELAKDSTGRLWVTFTQNNKVWSNHSLTSDTSWASPTVLPVNGTSLTSDDISGIIAFQGNKIGIMWSNQADKKMHFAVHLDSDPPTTWQPTETALPGPGENTAYPWADDHINLKTVSSTGQVYAAVKTSLDALNDSSQPLNMLLVRDPNGSWSNYTFSRVSENHTRAIIMIDEDHSTLYMFATSPDTSGVIYYKTTPLNNIQFPVGKGTPILQSSTDTKINNVTSMKQNANGATNIVVLAGDNGTHFYLHNVITLGSSPPPPPPPPPGSGTLSPAADSYVRDGSYATTNFGSAHTLFVKTATSSGYNRDSYFKFDTSGVSGTITSVKLRIWAALTASDNVDTSLYSVPDTSWSESAITWNNRPPLGSALDTTTVSGTTYAWYTLDATSYVQSERTAGHTIISLALHNPSSASSAVVQVNSRESSANQPQLVITVGT